MARAMIVTHPLQVKVDCAAHAPRCILSVTGIAMPPQAADTASPYRIILASASRYRAELLGRLGVRFTGQAADIDESRHANESPEALADRLAAAKAAKISGENPAAIVIGSDQVAALDDRVFGKPGTAEVARAQLAHCSGATLRFITSVCVRIPHAEPLHHRDITEVTFRDLDAPTIARYVDRDQPLDCAGSFKSEAGGIALIERMRTDDPTGLIGLPLIAVARMLRAAGVTI